MTELFSAVKEEYENIRVFFIRIVIAIIVSPVEIVFVLLGAQFGYSAQGLSTKYFDIAFPSSSKVVYEEFLKYWIWSLFVLLLHVLICWLVRRFFKIRMYLELLAAHLIAVIVMVPGLEGPAATVILSDLWFYFAVPTIFAFIQYLVFLGLIAIGCVITTKGKNLLFLLSCIVAGVLGYFITAAVWPILFYNYTK